MVTFWTGSGSVWSSKKELTGLATQLHDLPCPIHSLSTLSTRNTRSYGIGANFAWRIRSVRLHSKMDAKYKKSEKLEVTRKGLESITSCHSSRVRKLCGTELPNFFLFLFAAVAVAPSSFQALRVNNSNELDSFLLFSVKLWMANFCSSQERK